jgi:hypothetical protein
VDFAAAHGIHATNGSVQAYDRAVRDPLLVFWCHAEALSHRPFRGQRQRTAAKTIRARFTKAHFIIRPRRLVSNINRPDQEKDPLVRQVSRKPCCAPKYFA